MKNTKLFTRGIGIILGVALIGALAGCVGYVEPRGYGGGAYASVQDEYVYYPGYQVYYGSHTHQYYYPEGRSWVSRAAPPHVSAEILLAAPSVRLDFRDHPSVHHAAVVRQYPQNWTPPASAHVRQ